MNYSQTRVRRACSLSQLALVVLLGGIFAGLCTWCSRSAQAARAAAGAGLAAANTNASAASLPFSDGARTTLISSNAAGTNSGNNLSKLPALSADGRYVVFQSKASDLTATPDLNNFFDVFVRDTQTGVTTLVSVNNAGTAGAAFNASISADGRYIAFQSSSPDLVSTADTNNLDDIFVRDMQTGTTKLVSLNHAGTGPANSLSSFPLISANGHVVTFLSFASDLTSLNQTANSEQLYARDLQTNVTKLVSINSVGTSGGNAGSAQGTPPTLSTDGRFVAFESQANDLVTNDLNQNNTFGTDVFVRDLQTNTTTLVSVNSTGTGSGNHDSAGANPGTTGSSIRISDDGRFVAFASRATNLVTGITYPGGPSFFQQNVFVRDLQAGTTAILTVNSAGTAATIGRTPAMSADGRYVAYVTGSNPYQGQVFVCDRQTGGTTLVSVNTTGTGGGDTGSDGPLEMSADGRYVLFRSAAHNLTLVPDTNADVELFVRDLQMGATNIITTRRAGFAQGIAFDAADTFTISADGRAVAFTNISDLGGPQDTNGLQDVYLCANSAPVSIFIGDVSITEGDAATTDAAFNLLLSNASPQPVTVNYATADATAVAPGDYTPVAGTLTFNPGETSKTVHVAVSGDLQDEPSETFFVNFTQPTGATLARTQGVGLIVNDDNTPTLQFSAASFSVNEGDSRATITVQRTVNLGQQVTVGYMTVDDPAAVRCDDTVNNHSAAYARCDYATTIDTLTFAPGEIQKTFSVPIIDDAHVEGNETMQLRLFNPVGGILGNQSTATLTIIDNDTAGTANPIFNSPFFVRQQYLDFLSREPDTAGFNAWLNVLNNCADVNNVDPDSPAAGCDRIHVSSSFVGSQEFQLKGFFVFRFYRVAFDRLPKYTEIVADMRSVTGTTGTEVFAKKATFTNAFALRPEFLDAYSGRTNANFVVTLLIPYNLSEITTPDPAQPDGTTKVTLKDTELIARLDAQTLTRAQVLRAVADSDQVFNLEFNRAFVAMQYYGYLRRTPETSGYQAWLNFLNTHPTDFRTMVNGFMNSQEYRLRFGQL
jgi:hypothetical protein